MGKIKKLILLGLITFCSLNVFAQYKAAKNEIVCTENIPVVGVKKGLTDDQLMETVQKQTFRYFWHYGHPNSGMARERSNTVKADFYWDYINEAWGEPNLSKGTFGPEACAVGGTGFGIMATIVAVERKWISREAALDRLIKIADFLNKAKSFHGIYPHFMHGDTGQPIAFDRVDNGGDIVEHSYLMMGFLCARAYFNKDVVKEKYLTKRIDQMWDNSNWKWYTNGENKLYWHWSDTHGFDKNFPIWGYNEALITYIMAASSNYYAIDKVAYEGTWSKAPGFLCNKEYYGIKLPLGNYGDDKGGPLFFEQYTYMGINPNGLTDDNGIDYAEQTRNHTLINRAYCIENPKKYKGYGENCWGLTAGDSYVGYIAHSPANDFGVIQPTAAISSMPYTPKESMQAMRYFYENLGDKIWGQYGFHDGFNLTKNWYSNTYLAIDQGPIVVMLENYRTGLMWNIFMKIPEIQRGLNKLGFSSPLIKKEEIKK